MTERFLKSNAGALETYIEGLVPEWTSSGGSAGTRGTNADHIQVGTGAAWIESAGRIVDVPTALRPASNATLAASTWYYLYLYLDGSGDPAVELVTTAPAAPYKDTARTKTSDTSRRYLRAMKTNASGRIFNFRHKPGDVVEYLEDVLSSPFPLLSNGSATTDTLVACSGVVPVSSRTAIVLLWNVSATGQNLMVNTPGTSAPSSGNAGEKAVQPSDSYVTTIGLNASQQFNYHLSNTSSGAYIYCVGYVEER